MLAWRLATILPAMSLAVAPETTRIHRVAGLTGGCTTLMSRESARRSLTRGAFAIIDRGIPVGIITHVVLVVIGNEPLPPPILADGFHCAASASPMTCRAVPLRRYGGRWPSRLGTAIALRIPTMATTTMRSVLLKPFESEGPRG